MNNCALIYCRVSRLSEREAGTESAKEQERIVFEEGRNRPWPPMEVQFTELDWRRPA